ncbi:hypothetical protein EDF82_1058 [Raoultella sp. BIGb0399]|nr:hypothetical protein EDF82_1058 [Raoultella sp. BIGb0399]
MFNSRGQYSSAMMGSNTADNCNFMDNQFTLFISVSVCETLPDSRFYGEQHWRSAL